jgi:hypothetical protein
LSVSVSELLEYGRKYVYHIKLYYIL